MYRAEKQGNAICQLTANISKTVVCVADKATILSLINTLPKCTTRTGKAHRGQESKQQAIKKVQQR